MQTRSRVLGGQDPTRWVSAGPTCPGSPVNMDALAPAECTARAMPGNCWPPCLGHNPGLHHRLLSSEKQQGQMSGDSREGTPTVNSGGRGRRTQTRVGAPAPSRETTTVPEGTEVPPRHPPGQDMDGIPVP